MERILVFKPFQTVVIIQYSTFFQKYHDFGFFFTLFSRAAAPGVPPPAAVSCVKRLAKQVHSKCPNSFFAKKFAFFRLSAILTFEVRIP